MGQTKESKTLIMNITDRGLESNMQKDDGAFESWAIILKYHLSDLITTIIINWDDDKIDITNEHITQFYYRLNKFLQTYTWAITKRHVPTIPSVLLCHCPLKESAAKEEYRKGSEGELECEFVANNKSEYDCIDHQLPIGLFYDTIYYRNFAVFHNAYMNGSIKRINSVLLAEEIHPLITKGLLDFVNDSPRWRYMNIKFSSMTI